MAECSNDETRGAAGRLACRVMIGGVIATVTWGCAAAVPPGPPRGSAVVDRRASGEGNVRPAPHSATYELWDDDAVRVVKEAHVNRGEPIGFRRDDGRPVAVAGWLAVPVDDRRSYAWHLPVGDPVDDAELNDDARHQQVVAGAVLAGVGTALGVFGLVRLLWGGHL